MKRMNYVYIGALIAFFVLKGKLGTETFDKATLFIGIVVFVFEFVSVKIEAMKYTSPQVICNNRSWSHCGLVLPLGPFYIITLGDIAWFGISGWEGTLIVHNSQVRMLGAQIAVFAEVREKSLKSFSVKDRESLACMGLQGPFYFGLVSSKQKAAMKEKHIDVDKIMTVDEKKSELTADLVDILKSKTEAIDKVVSQSGRIAHTFSEDKGLWVTFKKWMGSGGK